MTDYIATWGFKYLTEYYTITFKSTPVQYKNGFPPEDEWREEWILDLQQPSMFGFESARLSISCFDGEDKYLLI